MSDETPEEHAARLALDERCRLLAVALSEVLRDEAPEVGFVLVLTVPSADDGSAFTYRATMSKPSLVALLRTWLMKESS